MAAQVLQGSLILGDRLIECGQVVVEDGLIQDVSVEALRRVPTHDYGDAYIMPGMIDLHVHGIGGHDVMDGAAESIDRMSQQFATHGVTGWLASTVTQSFEVTRDAILSVLAAETCGGKGRARILGIHLEGPFLNPEFKGMQNPAFLRVPDEAVARAFLEFGQGSVVRWSIAPELPGADRLIRFLRREGVYVSIAHTGATYEQAMEAVLLGATQVTHCFNAMTGLHHRRPGVVGAAMLADDLYTELIADGIHIHPAVMRLLVRVKGRERVMLVTDSMSAADMPDGAYRFGGHDVQVQGGVARLPDGTLASSTLTMDGAVRNLVRLCGASLVDAACMASTTPAAAMGLGQRKGKIVVGYDADLAVLDRSLRPISTWVGGEPVYPLPTEE